MKQYDVVKNPYRRAMPNVPLLLILQHDRNADSLRVLVGPLSTLGKATRRDVALTVLGQPYVLLPLDLSAVPRDALSAAPVANLAHESFLYASVKNEKVRRRMLDLMRAMADEQA